MAWLDFPDVLEPLILEITKASDSALKDGLSDWVFLALGSSGLAAHALLPPPLSPFPSPSFPSRQQPPVRHYPSSEFSGYPAHRFYPRQQRWRNADDQALFLHFQRWLDLAHPSDVNRRFAVQTEPNSFLSSLSRGYTFRASFLDPPQVLSSYCSLIHFGGLLVALSSARAMRQLCSTESPLDPALQLAVFLATAALAPCS
jgi:hypothetical protein